MQIYALLLMGDYSNSYFIMLFYLIVPDSSKHIFFSGLILLFKRQSYTEKGKTEEDLFPLLVYSPKGHRAGPGSG